MNQFHEILWIFFHINPNFIFRKWKNIQKNALKLTYFMISQGFFGKLGKFFS